MPLLHRKGLQDRLRGGLRSLWSDIEDAGTIESGENGDVIVPLPEALFVDTEVLDGCRAAPIEPALDGPIHDRLHGTLAGCG